MIRNLIVAQVRTQVGIGQAHRFTGHGAADGITYPGNILIGHARGLEGSYGSQAETVTRNQAAPIDGADIRCCNRRAIVLLVENLNTRNGQCSFVNIGRSRSLVNNGVITQIRTAVATGEGHRLSILCILIGKHPGRGNGHLIARYQIA